MADNTTLIENLKTRRLAISVELAAMSTTKAGGLPNRASEGINVDHQGYIKSLNEQMDALTRHIKELEMEQDGSVWNASIGI